MIVSRQFLRIDQLKWQGKEPYQEYSTSNKYTLDECHVSRHVSNDWQSVSPTKSDTRRSISLHLALKLQHGSLIFWVWFNASHPLFHLLFKQFGYCRPVTRKSNICQMFQDAKVWVSLAMLHLHFLIMSHVSGRGNRDGPVCLCECLSVCLSDWLSALSRLNRLTCEREFWYGNVPWQYLGQIRLSRS